MKCNLEKLNKFTTFAEPASCLCTGDPHCWGFEMTKLTLPEIYTTSACTYTLVQDNCKFDRDPTFKVEANFERVHPNIIKSFVKEVYISMPDIKVVRAIFNTWCNIGNTVDDKNYII